MENGCKCFDGYYSSDCSVKTKCKLDCNHRGTCDKFECDCFPGYYGGYCQGIIDCPNNCTSGAQGKCLDSGNCECFDGYFGIDCALV